MNAEAALRDRVGHAGMRPQVFELHDDVGRDGPLHRVRRVDAAALGDQLASPGGVVQPIGDFRQVANLLRDATGPPPPRNRRGRRR